MSYFKGKITFTHSSQAPSWDEVGRRVKRVFFHTQKVYGETRAEAQEAVNEYIRELEKSEKYSGPEVKRVKIHKIKKGKDVSIK